MAPNLSNMRCSIFEISAVQLRFVTEIALKSLFLCVNRSLIRYGFRSRARATILEKTVEKIAFLGGIFSKLRSRPILPSPLPLEAVLLGLQKKAGSLSICRKQLWTGGGGRGLSLRKAVDLEIVLLRYVVRINENIFSSSFVQDCSYQV